MGIRSLISTVHRTSNQKAGFNIKSAGGGEEKKRKERAAARGGGGALLREERSNQISCFFSTSSTCFLVGWTI